jgi:hypothetical protein
MSVLSALSARLLGRRPAPARARGHARRALVPTADAGRLEDRQLLATNVLSHAAALVDRGGHVPGAQSQAPVSTTVSHAGQAGGITVRNHGSVPWGFRYASGDWYRVGNDRVRFIAMEVSGKFTTSDIMAKARSVVNSYKGRTQAWDDLWYARRLPTSGDTYLLVLWHNMDKNQMGWAAVKNSPQTWSVKTNDGLTYTPTNDQYVKKTYTVNGKRIDLDLKNPTNDHGWTSNDFFYGFGY